MGVKPKLQQNKNKKTKTKQKQNKKQTTYVNLGLPIFKK
jgi:hypothetical protein